MASGRPRGSHVTIVGTGAVRAVAFGAASQIGAKGVALVLNVIATLALIRHFGPRNYGDFVFVFGFAGVVGVISDLGISRVAVREMSRDGEDSAAILGTSIAARLALALIAAVVGQALLFVIGARTEIHLWVAVASLPFFTEAVLSVVVVFQVHLAMQYESLVGVIAQVVNAGLVLGLVASGAGLLPLIGASAVSGVVGAGIAIALARRRFAASARFDIKRVAYLVGEAIPTGLALIITLLYLRFDSVLLALLKGPVQVGLYGAAYKPIEYVGVALATVMAAIFPLLSRWRTVDPVRYALVYRRGAEIMLALVLPVPVVLYFCSNQLVALAYPPAFQQSSVALQLLSIALVFIVLNAWQSFLLLSAGRQRLTLAYDAVALGANLGLNLLLIPRFGFMGAATAATATGFLVLCFSLAAIRHSVGLTLQVDRLARLAVGAAVLALTIGLLLSVGVPWWAATLIGSVSYPLALVALHIVTPAELRIFARDPQTVAA